jgi:hypothetical protein
MREELEESLTQLREQGLVQIDRLGLAHAEALLRRVELERPEVATLMLERLARRIDAMSDALQQRRDDVQRSIRQLPEEEQGRAQQWLDQGQLSEWTSGVSHGPTANSLAAISTELDQAGAASPGTAVANNLESELQQQELDTLAAAYQMLDTGDSPPDESSPAPGRASAATPETRRAGTPFRSLQLTRDTLRELGTRRVVARAARLAPKESGPLNPEKLTLQALVEMQELSENYLSRFVSYAETLMWLDKVTGKDEQP